MNGASRPPSMRRRRIVAALAGGMSLPRWAAAQSTRRTARLGVLYMGSGELEVTATFWLELAQRGFVEGRNLLVDRRYASGDPKQLPSLADELVALRPDVIFTASGTVGALAAKAATSTIPIVFDASNDPVGRGLVSDLARPGGNLTGTRVFAYPLDLKRMQMLVEVVKAPRCVAALDGSFSAARRNDFVAAFANLGLGSRARLLFFEAPRVEDLPAAFESMRAEQADAVVIGASPFSAIYAERIAALVAQHRLPAIADGRSYAKGGLLLTYSTDMAYIYRRGADYVSRILNGLRPAELPIEQAMKHELVVNLKTAKALGVQVPRSLLLLADEVIE